MPYTNPYPNEAAKAAAKYEETNTSFPNNIEAEKSVLAACMLSDEAVGELVTMLEPDCFFRPAHQIIFSAVKNLSARNIAIDQISLADNLAASGQLEAVGGHSYLLELADNTYALSSWLNHAEIVRRTAVQRDLIHAAIDIKALAYNAPDDLADTVGQSEKRLFQATETKIPNAFVGLSDVLLIAYEELAAMSDNQTHMIGVPTGFKDVDDLFHGFRGGDLVILAARPGVGKSSFALNIAINAAKQGVHVALFSLEMSKSEIAQRVLCSEARVPLNKIRGGFMSQNDWQDVVAETEVLSKLDVAIDDTPGLTILDARAKARRQLRKIQQNGEKALIVLDYLQLMQPPVARKDGNRAVEVGEISRGLKILAKELNVPILALSQLSRSVEQRGTSKKRARPQLSDLRESGAIEQDADIVMFIDRPINDAEAEAFENGDKNKATLIVAKHRHGACRDINLAFNPEYTRFMSYAGDKYAAMAPADEGPFA